MCSQSLAQVGLYGASSLFYYGICSKYSLSSPAVVLAQTVSYVVLGILQTCNSYTEHSYKNVRYLFNTAVILGVSYIFNTTQNIYLFGAIVLSSCLAAIKELTNRWYATAISKNALDAISTVEALNKLRNSLTTDYTLSPGVKSVNIDNIIEEFLESSSIGDIDPMKKCEFEDKCEFEKLYEIRGKQFFSRGHSLKVVLRKFFNYSHSTKSWSKKQRLGKQEEYASTLIQGILYFLLVKRRAFYYDKNADTKQLQTLITTTLDSLIDANTNCIDQMASQLQRLIVLIADNIPIDEPQKITGIDIYQYKTSLIKKIVTIKYPRERHQADLSMSVTKKIFSKMGEAVPKIVNIGARFNCVSNLYVKESVIMRTFFQQYNPVELLINQLEYHSKTPKLFINMSQWYHNVVYQRNIDQPSLVNAIGGNLVDYDSLQVNREAKLYYLIKNNIIVPKY